jgi:hypothetical protein
MPFFVDAVVVAVDVAEAVSVVAEVAEVAETVATVAEIGELAETVSTLGEIASSVDGLSVLGDAGGMLGSVESAGGLAADVGSTGLVETAGSTGLADATAAAGQGSGGISTTGTGIADSGAAVADSAAAAPDVTTQAIASAPSTPTPNAALSSADAGGGAGGGVAEGGDAGAGASSGGTSSGVMAPPDSFLDSISGYFKSTAGKQMLSQGISGLGKALQGSNADDRRMQLLEEQQAWEHNNMSSMPVVGVGINPNANVFGKGQAPTYMAPQLGQPGYVPPRPGLIQTVRK